MKAKLLIAAFLAMLAATTPVIAQGNGNSGGNSAHSEDGDTDESEDDAGTNSAAEHGNSGNNGNNGNGNGNGNGNNGGGNGSGVNSERSPSNGVTVVPEEDLLAIVKAGQAVSLASLQPNVEERTGGEIIDAQMVRTARSLIYVVKVMTPEGRVGIEYYNARSGTHIEAR